MRFTTLLSTSLALAAGANAMSATYVVNNINQLTVLSSETNEIAKSVSAGNINEKAPQLVSNFKQITVSVSQFISTVNAKRDLSNAENTILHKRQECLSGEDIEKCLQDLGDLTNDPSEILGGARKRGDIDLNQNAPGAGPTGRRLQGLKFTEEGQRLICDAFGEFIPVTEALLQTIVANKGTFNSLLSSPSFLLGKPVAAAITSLESVVDSVASLTIGTVPTCKQFADEAKDNLDMVFTNALKEFN